MRMPLRVWIFNAMKMKIFFPPAHCAATTTYSRQAPEIGFIWTRFLHSRRRGTWSRQGVCGGSILMNISWDISSIGEPSYYQLISWKSASCSIENECRLIRIELDVSAEKAKWWILDRVDGGAGIFEDWDLLFSDATNLTKDLESIVNIAASYYYYFK